MRTAVVEGDGPKWESRAYQLEMLEQSMQKNIIVAVGRLHRSRGSGRSLTLPVDGYWLWQNPHVRVCPVVSGS